MTWSHHSRWQQRQTRSMTQYITLAKMRRICSEDLTGITQSLTQAVIEALPEKDGQKNIAQLSEMRTEVRG